MDGTTGQIISSWIAEHFFWVFIGILFINILQRKHHKQAERKRFATLYIGIAAFGVYVAGLSVVEFNLGDWFLVPVLLLLGTILYVYREHTFPFRLTCRETGERLSWEQILYDDSNLSEKGKRIRGEGPNSTGEEEEEEEEEEETSE